MAQYIKRSQVTDALIDNTSIVGDLLVEAVNAICDIPASDVRPVVRGRWIKHRFTESMFGFECSVCHTTWDTLTDFCPFCGSDMRR